MPNFTQKHLSLILSAVAVVIVAAIAMVSFHAHQNNAASNNTGSTTSTSSGVTNSSGKAATSSTGSSGSTTGATATNSTQSTKSAGTQAPGATTTALYLSPAGTTLTRGATFKVQIRASSGSHPVNAVQANLSYPTSMLRFESIDAASSAFSIAAPSSGGNGKVSVARGSTTSLTGDQLVATVVFTVLANPGDANLAFTSGTALVTSDNHQNLFAALTNDVYHIQ